MGVVESDALLVQQILQTDHELIKDISCWLHFELLILSPTRDLEISRIIRTYLNLLRPKVSNSHPCAALTVAPHDWRPLGALSITELKRLHKTSIMISVLKK